MRRSYLHLLLAGIAGEVLFVGVLWLIGAPTGIVFGWGTVMALFFLAAFAFEERGRITAIG